MIRSGDDQNADRVRRSPQDALRLGIAAVVALSLTGAPLLFSNALRGAQLDLEQRRPLAALEASASAAFVALVAAVAAAVAVVVATRRWRMVVTTLTCLLMSAVATPLLVSLVERLTAGTASATLTGALVAAVSMCTVAGPWLGPRGRRAGAIALVACAATAVVGGSFTVYATTLTAAFGWLVGAATLVLYGSPSREPRVDDLIVALREGGIDVLDIIRTGPEGAAGARFCATSTAWGPLDVVAYSEQRRHADRFTRAARWLRTRDVAVSRPFTSLRRLVEHEALVSLKAHDDGVPCPEVRLIAALPDDDMLIVFEHTVPLTAGRSASSDRDRATDLVGEDLSDDDLRSMWSIAARLQTKRIAHRELRGDRFARRLDGSMVLTHFGGGELAAPDGLLSNDVVEVLASTALLVGPERAVRAAVDTMPVDVLRRAVRRLQPLVLTADTRRAMRRERMMEPLRVELQRAIGVDAVEYEELARVRPRAVVTVVVLALAVYALLPRLADVGGVADELATAEWGWLVGIVAFECLTYLGAGLAIATSVPERVSLVGAVRAQVAAAFVDIVSPHSIGGMALNTRYLQRQGVEPGAAIAGVGANAVAGIVAHLSLLGLFLMWARVTAQTVPGTGTSDVALPVSWWMLVPLVLIGLALAGASRSTAGRRFVRTRLQPLVRDARVGTRSLVRSPSKVLGVVGGSALTTMGFTGSFLCAVLAFGGGVSLPAAATLYLASWALASVVPTPSGLGALEVALIAGLGQLGMSSQTAISTVLVFRTVTLWLPVLPGWLTFHWMQHHKEI